jgi:putative DNA methylase
MSDHPVKRRKKLIEVAIPLEAINAASAREKSIRHGHPSTLHLWWARRPLAAARAVIFCQMVDDPSAVPEEFPTEEDQENERLRLFALISQLVQWENTTNEEVLNKARDEIRRSWRRCCSDNADHPEAAELFNPEKLPGFHDPFAGGGALPLEAQRLGLEAYASDLNPVAVLINKAMIEIPPKFAGMPPVNPEARSKKQLIERQWKGAEGLAEDVRYYGQWMRDEAEKRLGHIYPKVLITPEMVNDPENPRPDLKPYEGQALTVIAWLWARTVKSPNPAFSQVDVPLASTFMLSTKAGKEAYVQPVIEDGGYKFTVKAGKPEDIDVAKRGTKLARGANFRCLMSGTLIEADYIKAEGIAGRMGARMMAIVGEGKRGRIYLTPSSEAEALALSVEPTWTPETPLPDDPRNFWTASYGISTFGAFFTSRQLYTLKHLIDLLEQVQHMVEANVDAAHGTHGAKGIEESRPSPGDYSASIVTYIALSISRLTMRCSSQASWDSAYQKIQNTFGRQSLPMVWDYAEGNPFCNSSGSLESCTAAISTAIKESLNKQLFTGNIHLLLAGETVANSAWS